jgi:TPR repeat protein
MIDLDFQFFISALGAAESGLAAAQHLVGAMYDFGLGVGIDKAEAFLWYQRAAGQGHADSLRTLAGKYLSGDGVDRDEAKAARYLELAAGLGQPNSDSPAGRRPEVGPEPPGGYEAVHRITKAAEQALAEAQFSLGRLYLDEASGRHDPPKAVKWLGLAARSGQVEAQYLLALALRGGSGAPADPRASEWWLRQAAERGHEPAQADLRERLRLV